MRNAAIASGDFVWLVGSLCQLNRIPFDAALLKQQFAGPHTVRHVIEAAQAFGFRIGEHEPGREGLKSLRFPCIGFLKSEPAANDEMQRGTPAILFRADAERVLYFTAAEKAPQSMPASHAHERLEPYMLLARHESSRSPSGPDGTADEASAVERFGFRWFAAELLRHKTVWRDVLLGSLVIQLIGLATPLLTQVVIDKVVVHQTMSTLVTVALALAVFLVFNAGMSWLRQYLVLHTGNRVDAVLGSQVFRHLLRLHLPYFEARPTGVLAARLHAVETIREFLAGAAVSLILDLPFLALFVAVMFWYSWPLTLIALAMLLAIAALSAGVTPALRARLNRQFLLGARNQAFLTEHVAGIETVKSLQMEPRLEARYDDYLAASLSAGFDARRLSNTYNVIANALEQAMALSILCVGALLVMRNDGFTVGMLVAFQMFAGRLSQPLMRLAGLWQEFQQASVAVKRLGDIMNAPMEPHALVPSRVGEGKGAIETRDLGFRYSPDHPWLCRGLNLGFEAGKLHVIAGPSGSGKSTLAKLLLGFYRPEEGQILLDGQDIRHFAANELRGNFGVVPQETVLFSGTVYENLIAGNPDAGFDDVVTACRIAEVHDAIERLPKGYQTLLGEHGVGLSGGQKQRLAIARAVLKRPKLLIFDEATSALDTETAERFADTVNRLKGAATVIFIAHNVPATLEVDSRVEMHAALRAPATTER